MQYLIGLIGGWIARKISFTVFLVTVSSVMLIAYVAIFTYFISLIIKFYNLVSDTITYMGTASQTTDSIVQKMFGLLDCIGFLDAFYGSMPLIFSSLTSLFMAVFYQLLFKFYVRFHKLIVDIVK